MSKDKLIQYILYLECENNSETNIEDLKSLNKQDLISRIIYLEAKKNNILIEGSFNYDKHKDSYRQESEFVG